MTTLAQNGGPRAAANTPSGLDLPPLAGFVQNRLEQVLAQFDLSDPLEIVEIARECYLRGVQDAELKIGELL